MAHVSIHLLGTFGAAVDGESVATFESDKVRALLAFLSVESDRHHRRESIAGLLWPEHAEKRARHSLSQALSNLRHALDVRDESPPLILVSTQTLCFNLPGDHALDVREFANLLAECEAHAHSAESLCSECLDRLGRAISLYRGDFMEGFTLPGSAPFEEWCLLKREQFRRDVSDILARLCHHYRWCGDWGRALDCARRHVAVDPWREAAHRQLMLALSATGQRSAALAQYEHCRRTLAHELGVSPSASTTDLYRQIRDRDAALERLWRRSWQTPESQEPQQPPHQEPAFVARENELAHLSEALSLSGAGRGQVALVIGETGTGKTALLQEFARQAQKCDEDLVVLSGTCNAYTGAGDPYLPFREILGQLVGGTGSGGIGPPNQERTQRIRRHLQVVLRLMVELTENLVGTLLPPASLTALPVQDGPAVEAIETLLTRARESNGPDRRQGDILSQYVALLTSLAKAVPLLILLDDLQWIDGGSTELLLHLARKAVTSRILIVGAYRPSDAQLAPQNTALPLTSALHEIARFADGCTIELGECPGRDFVDALIDSEPNQIGEELRHAISQRTRGHALFTVELLHDLQARGVLIRDRQQRWIARADASFVSLPARIEATIARRLERLPTELLRILSVASIAGEVFQAEALARVLDMDEGELLFLLGDELQHKHRLVLAEGVRTNHGKRLATYRFAHILFQNHCYSRLSEAERVYLHERMAYAIETLCDGNANEAAPTLATHYEKARLPEKAVRYLRIAAERAMRLSATHEAVLYLQRALRVLGTIAEGKDRERCEVRLQMILATAIAVTAGYGCPASGDAYARSRELGLQLGQSADLFAATWGLWRHRWVRGELSAALCLARECLELAEDSRQQSLHLEAHIAMATTQQWRGVFPRALEHWEQAQALHRQNTPSCHAFSYGQEPGVVSLATMAQTLWHLGFPDQAQQKANEGLALARRISHPASLAFALTFAGGVHQMRREPNLAQRLLAESIELSETHGFAQWLAIGKFLHGWCRVELDHNASVVEEMQKSLDAIIDTGTIISRLRYLGLLAEAHKTCGQMAQSLAVLDRATALLDPSGERLQEAELYRLRGELMQFTGHREAESWLRQAIAVARDQSAQSLELRASVSLARLLVDLGQRREAIDTLTLVYHWFTEGFDTPDLVSARRLLASLDRHE